ncbi:MAG: KH domain-containing protein [Candidatus Nezhaarchaeota archaeon]|nr:KH domain-containing protein [Candidatus Nezhaarchaeota archaeon]
MAAGFVHRDFVHIPPGRVGVLIGEDGRVKKKIEEELGVKLNIDSEGGVVEISLVRGEDPSKLLRAKDIVLAIANGFSPERAFKLLDEDTSLVLIELRDYVGFSEEGLTRIKGRIIGEEGRARRFIEETTGALVSVAGDKVAIIGNYEALEIAKKAVGMLAEGRQHSTVYRFLMAKRREMKRKLRGLG